MINTVFSERAKVLNTFFQDSRVLVSIPVLSAKFILAPLQEKDPRSRFSLVVSFFRSSSLAHKCQEY